MAGRTKYLYFVDELTGEPVKADGYPLEVSVPAAVVPKLLPLMQVGMRAMSLYNGAAGIARMFGFPLALVPEAWRSKVQGAVDVIKDDPFPMLHEQAVLTTY